MDKFEMTWSSEAVDDGAPRKLLFEYDIRGNQSRKAFAEIVDSMRVNGWTVVATLTSNKPSKRAL